MTRAKCSFCGRRHDQVRLLLASNGSAGRKRAFICDVCVLLAMHGLVDKFTADTAEKP